MSAVKEWAIQRITSDDIHRCGRLEAEGKGDGERGGGERRELSKGFFTPTRPAVAEHV